MVKYLNKILPNPVCEVCKNSTGNRLFRGNNVFGSILRNHLECVKSHLYKIKESGSNILYQPTKTVKNNGKVWYVTPFQVFINLMKMFTNEPKSSHEFNKSLEICKLLLSEGSQVDKRYHHENQRTPLMSLVKGYGLGAEGIDLGDNNRRKTRWQQLLKIMEVCLDFGADVDAVCGPLSETPFTVAERSGNEALKDLLKKYKSNVATNPEN